MPFDAEYSPIGIDFAAPQRFYHLSGGLTLLRGGNGLCWLGSMHSNDMILFSSLDGQFSSIVPGYTDTKILGGTLYRNPNEMKEVVTDNFLLQQFAENGNCLAYDQQVYWSGVGHKFSKTRLAFESLLASRISTQILKSVRRIEKLSGAYRVALVVTERPKEGTKSFTQNKYAANIALEFGSLLDDLYALRDAINALIYFIRFGEKKFSTRAFEKAVLNADGGYLMNLIRHSMFDPTGDLLIKNMSIYRGVGLHSLGTTNPIVRDSIFTISENGPLGNLVRLVFPLYDNLGVLEQIQKGIPFQVSDQEFRRYAEMDNYTDALEFGYECFIRLLRIAEASKKELNLTSSSWVLHQREILEATFTDHEGNQRRFKRDTKTGDLKEKLD